MAYQFGISTRLDGVGLSRIVDLFLTRPPYFLVAALAAVFFLREWARAGAWRFSAGRAFAVAAMDQRLQSTTTPLGPRLPDALARAGQAAWKRLLARAVSGKVCALFRPENALNQRVEQKSDSIRTDFALENGIGAPSVK